MEIDETGRTSPAAEIPTMWETLVSCGGRKALAVVTVALLGAGCQGAATGTSGEPSSTGAVTSSETPSEQARVVVTRDERSFPPPCRALYAARMTMDFFEAIKNGDTDRIAGFFSEDQFQWYSVTEGNPRESGRHRAIRDRGDLAAYFEERFAAGELMELMSLRITFDPKRDLGHMNFVVHRSADDLAELGIRGDVATGKAGIDCADGKIIAWSMGMATGAGRGGKSLCRVGSDENPEGLPVACAEA